jgi:hypothetical protein
MKFITISSHIYDLVMKTNIIAKSKLLILSSSSIDNRGKAAHLLTAGTKKRKRPEYL